jgi:hypothetical protein
MLYGTRRGSRPALLPRVCGVTWEFVTRYGALDGRGEPAKGDSDLPLLVLPTVAITDHSLADACAGPFVSHLDGVAAPPAQVEPNDATDVVPGCGV